MSTAVVMPQMGESIAEGTVVRWIKKVGDTVDRDEPLFEISTDKVDAEIPAPAAGVLLSIAVGVGETVPVGSVVGTIGAAGEQVDAVPPAPDPVPSATPRAAEAPVAPPKPAPAPGRAAPVAHTKRERNGNGHSTGGGVSTADGRERRRLSPLVRSMAREHQLDLSAIVGTGGGGRVTKRDVLAVLERQQRAGRAGAGVTTGPSSAAGTAGAGARTADAAGRVEIQPLSPMRRKIAEHMVLSRRTSAHVHSVFHVDFSAVDLARAESRAAFERAGTKLTYMAAITRAAVAALGRHPIVNASLDGDNVLYRKDINIGIAVALESGLIVPVVKHADALDLVGLSRAIADVASRARGKQLKPDEVHGGTFTITNPGQLGAQFGLPIINQPQVAILGVGSIEKRPVVVDDAVAIRPMASLTLGFDHRLIDGAVADLFMADVKREIEHFTVGPDLRG
jgi:2-oxoglutarate dehydrogenase E2 component (dihydrolipoamide succinyltransferase)